MKTIEEKTKGFEHIRATLIGKDLLLTEMIKPNRRVFSIGMVGELMALMDIIESAESEYPELHKAVIIMGLENSGLFNLGGDLALFADISQNSREEIEAITLMYAKSAYRWNHFYQKNVITVSVVNGDAYGGGLEVAMGAGYSIAEKGYLGGFPEASLGFIPNAGAVEILARKIGADKAIRIITDAKIYSTEELFEIGMVDEIVEQGKGLTTAIKRVNLERKSQTLYNTMHHIKNKIAPLDEQSFIDTALTWNVLLSELKPYHIKKIDKVVALQEKKYSLL